MKTFSLIYCGLILSLSAPAHAGSYEGSTFEDVWSAATEGPYATLPAYKVTTASFFDILGDKLQKAASRTLLNESDVLPPFRKLLHANGVCLAGTWSITEDSPYSGYFAKGAEGLIVARASSALSETKRGEKRSFGLAGKIFPTLGRNVQAKTANFFVIDNLGGTFTPSYLDTSMTNDISALKLGPANAPNLLVAAAAGRALKAAEDALGGGNPFVRQLYPISELGIEDKSSAVTPRLLRIQGEPGARDPIEDFRDELAVAHPGQPLVFTIEVSSSADVTKAVWTPIGQMTFTEASASLGCDQRVHFAHPAWRK
jgi:hypothetical protein